MQVHIYRNTKSFCCRLELLGRNYWTGHWWANGWLNYPCDISMKGPYVVTGCTTKVFSSTDHGVLFPPQGPGENSPTTLCIIWVIRVHPRQVQMNASEGHREWKSNRNNFLTNQPVRGVIFAVYKCTGVIMEDEELFNLTKKKLK